MDCLHVELKNNISTNMMSVINNLPSNEMIIRPMTKTIIPTATEGEREGGGKGERERGEGRERKGGRRGRKKEGETEKDTKSCTK